ncbi:class I SAM-dependent methyltransferase [Flavobacterium sp. M31R6]|uniref:class I SAM-dependent methyltransferase n=1 Tax=Flavobacterium sp. M31R6 TaxID=2739062 RepID=UPI001568BFFA|nr:methyltransferase domain-containing protein [Flavobacterium sp. M31R6]QKJ64816.1 methyltransferase domain-containing protein [Flavobacterium sp. M31R6]
MDKINKDIIQWDVNSWIKALDFWESKIDLNNGLTCLELGGREGGLSLWLSLKGNKVICSDLKDVKNTAQSLHLKYDLFSTICYQDIDATNIPYENYFDIIVFKSIIGGIGRGNNLDMQKKVFEEIFKALKPGGKLLFAENLSASPIHQTIRKRFVNWANYWRYISINEMNFFLSDFSKYEMKTTGVLGTFGRNEFQRHCLSKIDDLLLNRVCPEKWKYIVYGIAVK